MQCQVIITVKILTVDGVKFLTFFLVKWDDNIFYQSVNIKVGCMAPTIVELDFNEY